MAKIKIFFFYLFNLEEFLSILSDKRLDKNLPPRGNTFQTSFVFSRFHKQKAKKKQGSMMTTQVENFNCN
jgi:hypothetical protein